VQCAGRVNVEYSELFVVLSVPGSVIVLVDTLPGPVNRRTGNSSFLRFLRLCYVMNKRCLLLDTLAEIAANRP